MTISDAGGSSARVVVGVDDSPEARAALRWAVEHAGRTGDRVRAVSAYAPPAQLGAGAEVSAGALMATDPLVTDPLVSEQALHGHAERWMRTALSALPAGAERLIDHDVVTGDAADALLEAAENAELLVVGNAGRGALAGAVTGSVALSCAHHARCPVVLVPAPDEEDGVTE